MTAREEIKDFLTSRRARVTPEAAGLPYVDSNRRVAGLRREEVASLAGISVDYYIRLERGRVGHVSDQVLDALARTLLLDATERDHLYRLVRAAATPSRRAPGQGSTRVRPSLKQLLDHMAVPAYVRNARFDVIAANDIGRALYSPLYEHSAGTTPNTARYVFFSPTAPDFFRDFDAVRDDLVAYLHAEAGKHPYDAALSALIGELSTRSEAFRTLWAAHDVRYHRAGVKRLHHPLVGDLDLNYEALDLPADPGLRLNVYSAAVGSSSYESLALLASWTSPTFPSPTPTRGQP